MSKMVRLLENALQAWEDIFMLYEARVRVGIKTGMRKPDELVGPVRHWRELRSHLLQLKGQDYDLRRFGYRHNGTGLMTGPTAGPMAEVMSGLVSAAQSDPMSVSINRAYESLPMQLASWTISSRRVFELSDDMVQRFLAADYGNYTWSDLLWPFDAFVVSLESPLALKGADAGSSLDMLLVSSLYGVCPEHALASAEGFECLPFYSRMNDSVLVTEFMPERDREWFRDAINRKRWVKLNKRIMKFMFEDFMPVAMSGRTPLPAGYNVPITWQKQGPIGDGAIAKILAGLCLYLEALPAGTIEGYSWGRAEKVPVRKCLQKIVTDGEYVCRVEDFNVLSPDTMSLFPEILREGPAYAVEPHWRRAHKRRRPGQGNNPDAPRDVVVKAAKVHGDQLPDGAVPGGSITAVR